MNLKLPKDAFVNKFIPKNKFFDKVFVNSKVKKEFQDIIQRITWIYKLSKSTINTNKTEFVEEIQIFEIELKEKKIPKDALKIIDKTIKYQILYIFKYEENFSFGLSIKKEKDLKYYFSDWDEKIDFNFQAVNLEILFENIVKKFIKNIELEGKDFSEIIEISSRKESLEKEISILENKMRNEKQFNKVVEYNKKCNLLKDELNNIE